MSLKARLIAVIVTIAALTCVATLTPMLFGAKALVAEGLAHEAKSFETSMNRAIEAKSRRALAQSAQVAAIPAAQAALASNDRDALQTLFTPGYADLAAAQDVRQFQFHTPDAHSAFRVHAPSEFGDDLSADRQTVVSANAKKEPVFGLERGRDGLEVRGVTPVFHDGRHVGSVEIGLAFGEAFFVNLLRESEIQIELYAVQDASGAGAERVYSSFGDGPLLSAADLGAALAERGRDLSDVALAAGAYAAKVVPVHDYAGDIVGAVHVLMPTAAYAAIEWGMIWKALAIFGTAMGAILAVAYVIGARLSRVVVDMADWTTRLIRGETTAAAPGADRRDEFGVLARSMAAIHERGVDAQRIRLGLDNSSAMMMLADVDYNIVFVNAPLQRMLVDAERDVRADLPNFDASALIGASIDIFHKNPAHQRGMLDALTSTHEANLTLGGLAMSLAISPVIGPDGERIGTVVEWRDKTAELRATEEIDALVRAALEGDFTRQANVAGAPIMLREMGERLNSVAASVNDGVAETNRVVRAMAEGDLEQRVSGTFYGAFAELQNGVNSTLERFSELVGQIAGATQSVRRGADDIDKGSNSLAARAEQQASTLEETAATMEEMSASIKSNADSSTEASGMAAAASQRAGQGGEVVDNAVSAMNKIQDSATKIADIISVIDGIAFQTNLLALNAAVEAARAGDAGKGFAVVASEVRALAQRSSDASRDIRQLIETSATQVSHGVGLVTQTGESLEGIVASINQVEEAITRIADASKEQASGVEEISASVSHMDQMTQQNSAMAEESASNARALAEQAQRLEALIQFFKLENGAFEASQDASWRAAETDAERQSAPTSAAAPSAPAPRAQSTVVAHAPVDDGDWSEF